MRIIRFLALLSALTMLASAIFVSQSRAAEKSVKVKRDYEAAGVIAPPAPVNQTVEQMMAKSEGCYSCHVQTDAPTMHESPAVRLGCIDCHGGNANVYGDSSLPHDHPDYIAKRDAAHVLPSYPDDWHYPSSANPERSYSLLNREDPVFIRFNNPSDYRVAR